MSIAGLSIDVKTLKLKIFQILRLVLLPQLIEAISYLIFSHLIYGYDYFFGFTLGYMMGALGPAVVISCILDLNNNGYGKHKELTPSSLLAISIDNIVAITIATILVKKLIPVSSSASSVLIFTGIPTE